jgi:UDP-N-acetylmuramoylalanine--D-glutamate ligase
MSLDLVILGAGESGTGAALLAKAKGLSVFVSDKGSILPVYKKDLEKAGIEFEENQHTESKVLSAKEMVKSPGIPEKAEMVAKALAAGIPVIDELEFASRYTNARFIGITGSNGKTTTTLLTYHLMQACGFSVGLGGNIGQSLARQVITDAFDWYVLEISSFQLDGMHSFRSDIAILTNITPDHLDRYDYKFENYIASKFRIAQNLGPEQSLIISACDPVVSAEVRNRHFACSLIPVALNANASNLVFVAKGSLVFNHTAPSFSVPVSSLPISGDHNLMNAMMAISAVSLAGGDADKIREGAKSFVNAPHRCEFVTEISGVRFINDSKATNVDSVKYAFSAFEKPIVWIAGGVDKGNDYTELDEAVRSKVKALICLGKENDKLKTHFGPMLKLIEETQSVDDLIDMALRISEMGDTVLLSPACASFDLFRNYEDRGNQFKAAVLKAEAVLQSQTVNHEKR